MPKQIDTEALAILFTEARSQNGWIPGAEVSDELIQQVYALASLGPTSANCCPARFALLRSKESKERLRPLLSRGNVEKTMTAPLTVIVAYDAKFFDALTRLFPHGDAKSWFVSSPELAGETAMRNSSLQAAYLLFAARAVGLDASALSGFDATRVDQEFFLDTDWKSNLIINVGYGDPDKVYSRLPRLSFEEACLVL